MNVRRFTMLMLFVLVLTVPVVQANTVTFTVSGDLGPIITNDPLGLAGHPFSLTGTITQGPSGQTSYTVDTLSVTATALGITETLVACGTPGAPAGCAGDATTPTLNLTTSSASLTFDVAVAVFPASLSATVNLPAGTFQDSMGNVALENFSGVAVQSGSSLSYNVPGPGFVGEVGISGTASMSGVTGGGPPPPPGVPEPTTIALMAGGLLALAFRKRLHA